MEKTIHMKVDAKILSSLNQIYKEILLRPVDEEGIKQYSKYIPYRENYIRKMLMKSTEYKNLNNKSIDHTMCPKNILHKYRFISGIEIAKQKIIHQDKKILVLSLVKNCIICRTLDTIQKFIDTLSTQFQTVKFGFLTNNNLDDTENKLKILQETNTNIHLIVHNDEHISIVNNGSTPPNKIAQLALYRERLLKDCLKQFHPIKFDYIIVYDSDISFNTDNIVQDIIDSISIDTEWSAISANNCFEKSSIHYDTLALRLHEHPIDIGQIYPNFKTFYGYSQKWNTQSYIFQNFVDVQCAFGGMTIYNAKDITTLLKKHNKLYDTENFPEYTCEHICLDSKLPNKHFINSNMKLPSNTNIEGDIYGAPMMFIPRDAGFFSVFNFLIGTMSRGCRVYPYFNKNIFLKHRNENKHFCYWTDDENSWLSFFEPVSYYSEDNEHIDKTFLKYKISCGEEAPEEFKTPRVFGELLKNSPKDFLQNWRNNIHGVFKQYINFKQDIVDEANKCFDNMFCNHQDFIIGVHYRHPSHNVECGEVYLQDYFNQIDQLLIEHPKAQIFLCTDTEFGVMSFKHRYQHRLRFIETIDRLPVDNILQWAYALNKYGKADCVGLVNNQGYQLHNCSLNNTNNINLTKNLLIEVLCLSKCNILINTTSNISLALSYINPDIPIITI